VRNLGFDKRIQIHYTNDAWQTEKTLDAKYAGAVVLNGYCSVNNPNGHNVERWSFNTSADGNDKIEYYVTYEVDGQTHVDNNYGANYTVVY